MTKLAAERIVVFGNSGAGKSSYAKWQVRCLDCAHLDLDSIAWAPDIAPPTRRAIEESRTDIEHFVERHPRWVIEGCYADLLEIALPQADQVIFLNPGIETCMANAKNRPWEPHKYSSPEAQEANLSMLLAWIKDYDQRRDEFSYAAHRALFDQYAGCKQELRSNDWAPAELSTAWQELERS